MKTTLALALILAFPVPAMAQYIYLDSNGNGFHDAGDCLNANGTPTTVDVWLTTDKDRDGSEAAPDDSNLPFNVFSYVVNLEAVGGFVTYSNFINRQEAWWVNFIELNPDGVHYKNGYGGMLTLDPGTYRLCTLTITGVTGSPKIDIVDMVPGSFDYTSFGTQCWGNAWDDTYKLDGPNTREWQGMGDFFDADGVAAAAPTASPSPTPSPSTPPSTPAVGAVPGEDDPAKCGGSSAGRATAWIFGLLALALVSPRFRY